MSLANITQALTAERENTRALERSLIDLIEGQQASLEILKDGIREEIAERDRALQRIINGDAPNAGQL